MENVLLFASVVGLFVCAYRLGKVPDTKEILNLFVREVYFKQVSLPFICGIDRKLKEKRNVDIVADHDVCVYQRMQVFADERLLFFLSEWREATKEGEPTFEAETYSPENLIMPAGFILKESEYETGFFKIMKLEPRNGREIEYPYLTEEDVLRIVELSRYKNSPDQ